MWRAFAFGPSSHLALPTFWRETMTTTMVSDLLLISSAAADNDTEAPNTTLPPAGGVDSTTGYAVWLMPVIFGIIILVGVVGNTLVIFVILRAGQRTVTNYYIVNLAVADILFLAFCAPPTAAEYSSSGGFLFGRFMCKFILYLQNVTVQATCLLLTAMSVDRFQAIVRPLKSLKTRTLQSAIIISIIIWLVALLLYIPLLIFFDIEYRDYNGVKPYCLANWPSVIWVRVFIVASFVLGYALPLTVIAACYSVMIRHLWQRVVPTDALNGPANAANAERHLRQKRKITWMVLTVVLVFAINWFPIHLFNMWRRFDPYFPYTNDTLNLKTAGHVMSYANSCANPFIYAFLGENFRKSFRKVFPCFFKKPGPGREGKGQGGTTGTHQGPTAAGPSRAGGVIHNAQISALNSRTDM